MILALNTLVDVRRYWWDAMMAVFLLKSAKALTPASHQVSPKTLALRLQDLTCMKFGNWMRDGEADLPTTHSQMLGQYFVVRSHKLRKNACGASSHWHYWGHYPAPESLVFHCITVWCSALLRQPRTRWNKGLESCPSPGGHSLLSDEQFACNTR